MNLDPIYIGAITVGSLLVVGIIAGLVWKLVGGQSRGGAQGELDAAAQPLTVDSPPPSDTPCPDNGEQDLHSPSTPSLNEPAPPAFDIPEAPASRMARLRASLASSGKLGQVVLGALSRTDLSASDWEEIEDTLIMADLGLGPTSELLEGLKTAIKVSRQNDPDTVRSLARQELLKLVNPGWDRSLNLSRHLGPDGSELPAVVLMVGVNGAGKTTTLGKLARLLVAEGHSVLLGAADTFRAAAAEQLQTWGQRVGVEVVRSEKDGADPASVAFEALGRARQSGVDIVMVDTAGRLQNKTDLMDELGKVKRVMEKQAPVCEVLLVLDATTGQNGIRQAQVFAEVAGVSGIVLTKLDGSAKGGIVVGVQRELGVPVKLVGLGEGPDDLVAFDPQAFVDAILDTSGA